MILNNKSHLRLSWSTTNMILKLLNLHYTPPLPLLKQRPYCTSNCSLSDHVVHTSNTSCTWAMHHAREPHVMHVSHASCTQAMHCACKWCVMHMGKVSCRQATCHARERCVVHAGDVSCTWLTHRAHGWCIMHGVMPSFCSCWRCSNQ